MMLTLLVGGSDALANDESCNCVDLKERIERLEKKVEALTTQSAAKTLPTVVTEEDREKVRQLYLDVTDLKKEGNTEGAINKLRDHCDKSATRPPYSITNHRT